MNFSLSEEQRLLEDSAKRFVRETCPLDRRRALVAGDPGYSEESWRRMAELGWLGVTVPETCGGIGGGPVETMVLMEAFGAGLVVEPFFPSVVLGGNLVALAGSEAQQQAILPALVSGESQARVRLGRGPVRLRPVRRRDQGRTMRRRLRAERRQGRGARRRHRRQAHRLRAHERSFARSGRHRAVPRGPRRERGDTARLPHRRRAARSGGRVRERGGGRRRGARRSARRPAGDRGGGGTGRRRALRGGGRGDGRGRARYRGVPEDSQAVRPADRRVPGAAAPARRHVDGERGSAVDDGTSRRFGSATPTPVGARRRSRAPSTSSAGTDG